MLQSKRYSLKYDDGGWLTAGAGGTAAVNTAQGSWRLVCPAAGGATTWDGVSGFNGPSIYRARPGDLHGRHILYRARVDPAQIADADGRLGIFVTDCGSLNRYAIFTDQARAVTASWRPAAAAASDLRTVTIAGANPLWLQIELWGSTLAFLAGDGGGSDAPPIDGLFWQIISTLAVPGGVAVANAGGVYEFGAMFFTVGAHGADETLDVRDPALIALQIPSTW